MHVILVEPEIPQNTGSIARLCAATNSRLHLIRPLGFALEDRYLKRAGLDYWPFVDLAVHDCWEDLPQPESTQAVLLFSARSSRSYLDASFDQPGPLHLVFGCETRGLPANLLQSYSDRAYRIPHLSDKVRSLNLANAVSIIVYEALRRRGMLAEGD